MRRVPTMRKGWKTSPPALPTSSRFVVRGTVSSPGWVVSLHDKWCTWLQCIPKPLEWHWAQLRRLQKPSGSVSTSCFTHTPSTGGPCWFLPPNLWAFYALYWITFVPLTSTRPTPCLLIPAHSSRLYFGLKAILDKPGSRFQGFSAPCSCSYSAPSFPCLSTHHSLLWLPGTWFLDSIESYERTGQSLLPYYFTSTTKYSAQWIIAPWKTSLLSENEGI